MEGFGSIQFNWELGNLEVTCSLRSTHNIWKLRNLEDICSLGSIQIIWKLGNLEAICSLGSIQIIWKLGNLEAICSLGSIQIIWKLGNLEEVKSLGVWKLGENSVEWSRNFGNSDRYQDYDRTMDLRLDMATIDHLYAISTNRLNIRFLTKKTASLNSVN